MTAAIVAVLILLWAHVSKKPWRDLGFVKPDSWISTVVESVILGVVFKVGMKALVMPLLGANAVNQPYHYLAGNTAELPGMIALLIVGAGFGEELFFRSFLFDRLGKLLPDKAWTKAAIVVFTAALFASAHLPDQGWAGAEQAAVTGLVFGAFYANTGRIVPVMIAHASFDLAALAMIYYDVEPTVAHLIFR
jgi:membrane protease YdiL (CAAX protease family)